MPTAELRPEHLTVIIDPVETRPIDLAPFQAKIGRLIVGQYSVKGLEHQVAILRLSLDDIVHCCGRGREAFEAKLRMLKSFPVAAVVYESSWADILAGEWMANIPAKSVKSSINAWLARYGVPFVPAGSHAAAAGVIKDLLFYTARDAWRALQGFQDGLKLA